MLPEAVIKNGVSEDVQKEEEAEEEETYEDLWRDEREALYAKVVLGELSS